MKKILLVGIIIFFATFSQAKLFDFNSVEPPFFGCSITGCMMQGDIDMNGYIIYNATFVNATLHEFDPVFTAENSTIWAAINGKLNETDQRYNDTQFILNQLLNYYNKTEIDTLLTYYYNKTEVDGFLDLKLNVTDQRYNDTQFILNALLNYYNKSESDGLYYPLSNPAGYINESFANGSYYPLNSNPAGYINESYANATYALNTSLSNYYTINESNNTFYPRYDNPEGYLTNASLNNATGPWVLKAGDTMTGGLNMSNNSIYDVDVLYVHNITGRSPIFVSSDMISVSSINATNFYGNINGQNGTIFGMTITNGTIENMHVSGSAVFNTSLLPEINDTWSLGSPDLQWKDFHVVNLYATNITSPNVNQYYADQVWIYRAQYGNTTDYIFYFNESKLNITLQTINEYLYYLNDSLYNETQARIGNDSYLQGQINYLDLYKLNTSDQRYNDTQFILNQLLNYYNITEIDALFANFTYNETDPIFTAENTSIWAAINDKLNITDQRYNDTAYIVNLLLNYYNITETDNLLNDKLNITDQRYNDTQLISNVNSSIWQELDLKLNISDQRYNDTQYIINALLNYYNKTEIDNMLLNYLQNETDPIFTAENTSIWAAINDKLNITDQRYNDTQYIINALLNYYNKTEIDGFLDLKLNVTDQRYNDTGLINSVNQSIWNELALKLNISDQRYNDTAFILNELLNYYNKTEIDFLFANYTFNETDPIFTAENISIWAAINLKLNETDQRYNDTQYIINALLNYYNKTEIDTFLTYYYNKTEVDGFLDLKLNVTDQRYNDTGLINSVNQSVWNELALKLNITDQRYNDTQYIINALLNYYNISEIDTFFTYYYNKTEIDGFLDLKLNVTDQRYNDTQYIINALMNYYNKTEIDGFLDLKLNTTDQRYNDTGLINSVNQSIWNELALKLNISDQRYNDTQFILNQLLNYYNKTEIDFLFQNFTYNETDPVFSAENVSIWMAINTKLNETDQRYNDTQYIINALLNYYNKTEIDTLLTYYYNKTEIDGFLDLKLNVTDQRYNDTGLINSVNQSIWNELALKLNITDQRYNDTQFILNELMNYYNKTEIDFLFQNFTYNETDPIFTAENTTLWQAINSKLNITDQRYNDTQYIINALMNYYNKTEVDGFLDLKLNVTDQRYNDTGLINSVNQSIWNELALKLNITDQRYNDTQYILNQLMNYYNITEIDTFFTYYYNKTEIDGFLDLKLNVTDQRYNDTQYIINQLLNYYNKTEIDGFLDLKLNVTDQRYNDTQFVLNQLMNYYNMSYIDANFYNQTEIDMMLLNYLQNETDPIFTAENISIWQAINSKLNITDQRYNDTQFILNALMNYYNKTEIDSALDLKLNVTDQRYNDTQLILDVNATIKQPTGPYLAYDNTTFWVNESALNYTINNISKVRKVVYNMTCTAVNGTCNVISAINISHEITEVKVTPTTITNNYKFQLTEYPTTTNIIDKDRSQHVGIWDIEKSYAINGQVQATITNANINELFTTSIIYLTNGVQ